MMSSGEIMLFGVRVKVDPLRKSVSMNDLSHYVQACDSSSNHVPDAVAVDSGYASADHAARNNHSNAGRERKRGVPWTEDEHKLFLLGLQQVGKGDWRGISRKFVKTRTPTQVASHAQKYFLRRSNLNRRRRRSSLFDITTDSVADTPMEEQVVHEVNNSQPMQPPMQSSHQISPLSMAAFPAAVGPVSSSLSIKNQMETVAFSKHDRFNVGPTPPVRPIPVLPILNLSTRADSYLDQKRERDMLSLSLSLNLSLSCDHNSGAGSSGFSNKDGLISVG
ncbi:putative transcription factor MYB-HB-like family [Helianthus debilis subsp. tardiflorus]